MLPEDVEVGALYFDSKTHELLIPTAKSSIVVDYVSLKQKDGVLSRSVTTSTAMPVGITMVSRNGYKLLPNVTVEMLVEILSEVLANYCPKYEVVNG